ncbi:MAG: WD40 repeat domain-containing protein [Leptolyngbyaceae cyanobacterium]
MRFKPLQSSIWLVTLCLVTTSGACALSQPTNSQPILVGQEDASNPRRSAPDALTFEKGASFEGLFRGFAPNGKSLTTQNQQQIHVFDIDGTERSVHTGAAIAFASNSEAMVVIKDEWFAPTEPANPSTELLTLDGEQLASFPGFFAAFMPDAQQVIIYGGLADPVSRLWSFDGEELAAFEGRFYGLTPEQHSLITYSESAQKFHVFDFEGTQIVSFPAASVEDVQPRLEFTPDRERVVIRTGASPGKMRSHVFDRNGVEQATFPGIYHGVLANDDGLILIGYDADGSAVSRLVRFNGEELASFKGYITAFTPDGKVVTVNYNATHVYQADGIEMTTLPGAFVKFAPDETNIVTSDFGNGYLYDLEGTELGTFAGGYTEFWPEQQLVVTTSAFDEDLTRFYHIDGTEIASLPETFQPSYIGDFQVDLTGQYPPNFGLQFDDRVVTYSFDDHRTDVYFIQ